MPLHLSKIPVVSVYYPMRERQPIGEWGAQPDGMLQNLRRPASAALISSAALI